ncbi:MAG: hypothetical protein ACD_9C00174G0001 [uncultured bacterium]|nr:MAG: hypothetical protein ACD_9C00174G0001 [uncultured bacterium]
MEKTRIVIPYWKSELGTETEVSWIKMQNGSYTAKRRGLLDFFKYNNYYGNFTYSDILEVLSCDRALGLFATYERNYTYLEAKGDIDTEVPTSDDLFRVAGLIFGMPVTREKLEKILKANKLQPLFASGSPEVFYYETWFDPRYEKNLKRPFEDFILSESRKIFLNCITVETEKSTSIKRTLLCNTNTFSIL